MTLRSRGAGARVERSVFLTQLLVAGALLLLVGVSVVVDPAAISAPLYFYGVVIVFGVTGLAAAVPWRLVPKGWIALLPVLDIVAIVLIREAQPLLGATFLLVFPVIWMATHFGFRGAVGSVLIAAVLLWGGAALRNSIVPAEEIPRLAIMPIVLAFVATATYITTRRARAQSVLLTQQAGLFEVALQRSRRQERLQVEIFDAIDFGVVSTEGSGAVVLQNRAQKEMMHRFGVQEGTLLPAVVHREDRETPYADSERPFTRALAGETVDRVTVWVGEPGSTQAALLVSARPLQDDAGRFDGAVLVSRDVTAELRAIQARDDLVASVSHELRTPLTSVLGYLELALDDERVEDGTRRMLTVASKNADRLLALVADLLTAAGDSQHALLLAFAPCSLADVVAESVESARPLAAERDIVIEVDELVAVETEADAFRLRQVVDNLLSNAIKYNVRSGRIRVAVRASADEVQLRVTDTGQGMSDDEQRNLFDRFYRADSVRGSSVHGTGLGLSISRDIMRQHGGDLRLESASGVGTTAIATLPRGIE